MDFNLASSKILSFSKSSKVGARPKISSGAGAAGFGVSAASTWTLCASFSIAGLVIDGSIVS
jgi:hypothetical protein